MQEVNAQPATEPSPTSLAPQPNQVLAEPATVDACTRDYEQAADVRQTLAAQEARQH